MKTIALSVVLLLGAAGLTPVFGQVKDDLKTAGDKTGDAVKDGAHETKTAAKKTGHVIKKDTVKGAKATEHGADKAGHVVKTDSEKPAML